MTMKLDAMMSQHQLNTSCGDMDASVYSAITEASEMTTKHSNSKHVPASLHKDTARTMQTSTTHTFHSFFNQSASSFCSDDDEDNDEGSEGSIDMYDESEDNIDAKAVEAASITYMGRNYEASEFLNATQVLEESFRGVRSHRRMNENGFNGSASELLLGKWALLKGGDNNDNNTQKARDMAMSTASMGFTASEHLSDRWARLEEQEADEEEELGSDSDHSCDIPAAVVSSSPPKRDLHSSFTALFGGHNLMSAVTSNEQKAEVTSEKQQRRANRRRKNHSGGKKKLPPKSKSLTGSSKVSLGAERTLSNSSSSSRGIPARPRGHGSCSNLRLQQEMNLSLSDHSSMRNSSFRTTGGSTRSTTNHESFIHKVFGIQGGLSAEELEQQEWTEKGLQRWGYTNTDVVNIVKDDETFAKLKRNLRNRKAVTNSLVVQRLHVFVKNQKQKHKKAAAAIMQKQ